MNFQKLSLLFFRELFDKASATLRRS